MYKNTGRSFLVLVLQQYFVLKQTIRAPVVSCPCRSSLLREALFTFVGRSQIECPTSPTSSQFSRNNTLHNRRGSHTQILFVNEIVAFEGSENGTIKFQLAHRQARIWGPTFLTLFVHFFRKTYRIRFAPPALQGVSSIFYFFYRTFFRKI